MFVPDDFLEEQRNLLVLGHESAARHDTGPGHPERPERYVVVRQAIEAMAPGWLERREAPLATREQLARVHDAAYIDAALAAIPASGRVHLDADTVVSPGSREAVLRAAGGVVAAVDAVLTGETTRAFSAMRPPGHHAEPGKAMGFCLFDSVAVGAAHARVAHGIGKIAIVDFDVHHGNGTQAIFWDDPKTLYVSTHQWPLYPGTGAASERGAHGNILNVPLPPGCDGLRFQREVEDKVLPALQAFAPELLFISAGFDAHRDDPLAGLRLHEDDFAWVTTKLVEIAKRHCAGRVVSVLEGGYDLDALGKSVVAHLQALRDPDGAAVESGKR